MNVKCPRCGTCMSVDNQVKDAVQVTVTSPAPTRMEIAQARFDRDARLGNPVVEVPAGVVIKPPQKPVIFDSLSVIWIIIAFTILVVVFYAWLICKDRYDFNVQKEKWAEKWDD